MQWYDHPNGYLWLGRNETSALFRILDRHRVDAVRCPGERRFQAMELLPNKSGIGSKSMGEARFGSLDEAKKWCEGRQPS